MTSQTMPVAAPLHNRHDAEMNFILTEHQGKKSIARRVKLIAEMEPVIPLWALTWCVNKHRMPTRSG
jgi:hypothetical protein